MISNEYYRSGASWEYVSQSLEPGLKEFTSLSHPWGGAPTYVLTNYVAGIRPLVFGFRHWIVNPMVTGLNITSANATVSTPYGALTAGAEGVFEVALLNSSTFQQKLAGTGEPIVFSVQL
ncbi:glycoside hydrolase, putative [Phytophthora infestans T30-4]|uniref:Glycoside hydrolase, putative n=1 Tax=Phytophthora infestans (strain T30-4) TaxID=403677 RepID=D0MU14_PHYIT|nr:glycoside hydrolase, putative [Phytophthora infestans T30-4]EEY61461.1 glycoside hydrolase, putative [Phytophthora infestans T30-4]|eukprot:XP_002908378.1 glycoside hydrolase, putative [Phytophthora infestans T30-4]